MLAIGITGNFGMGKSTVLKLFRKLGEQTFNVDEFVRDILKQPVIIKKISGLLGSDILMKSSGKLSINKRRVASIVFNDPQKRIALEKIIHPEVLKKIKQLKSKKRLRQSSGVIFIEVPLLFEAGYEKYFDMTIVVSCKRETALKRLMKKGFARDDAMGRIRAQMPITKKKKFADFVIDNNGNIKKTEEKVKKVMMKLKTN